MQNSLQGMRMNLVGSVKCESEAAFPEAVVAIAQKRAHRESTGTRIAKASRPSWWLLYTILPITILLFVVAAGVSPTNGWRTAAEFLSAIIAISSVALWVHANRMALILTNYGPHSEETADRS